METATTATLTAQHVEAFRKIVGEQFVFVDEESLNNYAHDETENYTTQESSENIRLNFSSVPNTFADPRQITHG